MIDIFCSSSFFYNSLTYVGSLMVSLEKCLLFVLDCNSLPMEWATILLT